MSYCGKSCEECVCREKGHESCETCGFKLDCSMLRFCHREPEERIRREEVRQRDLSEIAQRLPILRRWLWLLLWMMAVNVALASIGVAAQYVPVLEWPAKILGWLYNLAYVFILMKLSSAEKRYKTAGMFCLIESVFSVVLSFIPRYNDVTDSLNMVVQSKPDENAWYTLVRLLSLIPAILYMYYLFKAHSEALVGIDNDLSEKWERLWKWHVYALAAIPIGLVVTFIWILAGLTVLGALFAVATLAAMLSFVVFEILRWVYLYRSARVCRDTVVERIT